ncbi:4057_t:CDS:2, partial [Gigaspora rosea]
LLASAGLSVYSTCSSSLGLPFGPLSVGYVSMQTASSSSILQSAAVRGTSPADLRIF